ncbi:hypothetical protein H6F98_06020 [Microcoleus sp. FACHB-SPT15]|uniref:hypothetical protein n=1 Tax=Microcoleus sp. FACHB-SPT15 TaxID=2692830 RepID=UPI00177BC49D|nr:hypothetical protein [Microcoleus sp. FACHB-SPT15]MBD1805007.1 hypothetical protein [Microcoleus sp. FACHB-SPT15]
MMSCRLYWRTVRLTYPWLPLAIALWRMASSTGVQRSRAQVRFWMLLTRIDFANLFAIVSEMSQPEYWA